MTHHTGESAYVYAAVRTPFGKFNGGLSGVRPDDLAATAMRGVLATLPDLDPQDIGDVVWGNANGAGEDNRNVGRMAVLLSGLPVTLPATTVNRLCGSSLDAAMIGSRTVESGDADIVLVGGVESMTRAPWVLPKPARPFPAGDMTAVSTTLGWRLVNPSMPAEWTASLGECNEQLQEKFAISRQRQDVFAMRSHQFADAAWNEGFYDDLTVAVPGTEVTRDESIRPGTSVEKLATLTPSFRAEGTITAGNASPLNDGASAVVLGSRRRRRGSVDCRWLGSPAARPPPSSRRCSGTHRSRPPRRHCGARESSGRTSAQSSSTRRSPCSRWPVSTRGGSTPTS